MKMSTVLKKLPVAAHFGAGEYRERIRRLVEQLEQRGLAGILLFAQETAYYVIGYDSPAYSDLQALFIGANGRMILITRSADVRHTVATSLVEEITQWVDRLGLRPAQAICAAVADFIAPMSRIGVEYTNFMPNSQYGVLLQAAFAGVASLVDASDLVPALQLQKSPAELVYVRRAGAIADAAFCRAVQECRPGAPKAHVLAELFGAVLRHGGEPVSGRFFCDGELARRAEPDETFIGPSDQINFELAACYRQYRVALMRTVLTGTPSREHLRMHAAAVEALEACRKTLRPGKTFGDLFDVHAGTIDRHGYERARLNASGYSVGAECRRSWTTWPNVCPGNPIELTAGMVVFLHTLLRDRETNTTMTIGETYIVTDRLPERLSELDYSLIVQ